MLRSIFIFLIILFASTCLQAQVKSDKDLLGTWEGREIKLNFQANGRIVLILQGGSMPGATYKTDFRRIPAMLEITVSQAQQKKVFRAAISFINNTTLKMESYDDNDPASSFLNKLILYKK